MATLVVVSNLGLEVGLGYLAQTCMSDVDVRILPPTELRTTQTNLEKYARVVLCGDWESDVCPSDMEVKVIKYTPGTSPTLELLMFLGCVPSHTEWAVLQLLDEHLTSPLRRPIVQHFATGLANLSSKGTHQMLEFLIKNPQTLVDVLNTGEMVYENHFRMVRNRVAANSRPFRFKDFPDIQCAMGAASELTVMTHAALHAKYPEASVSIVVNFVFGEDPAQFYFSLRSYDETDVREISRHFGGGGTNGAGFITSTMQL